MAEVTDEERDIINDVNAEVMKFMAVLLHETNPMIVAGVMTLGVMQQILRAFGRVEGSLQYLFKAWPTIIELASVYRRLREFEKQIKIKEIEVLES